MQYSGIVVTVLPPDTESVAARLSALPGVETPLRDGASGRIVVVLETPAGDAFEAAFRGIQGQPGVISTELAYHFVDEPQNAVVPLEALRRSAGPGGASES